jgi:hypothetical protein
MPRAAVDREMAMHRSQTPTLAAGDGRGYPSSGGFRRLWGDIVAADGTNFGHREL